MRLARRKAAVREAGETAAARLNGRNVRANDAMAPGLVEMSGKKKGRS